VETAGGTVTSTKLFVWCSDNFRPYTPCEARNAAGAITSQYFSRGQTISGANYFYITDGLANPSDLAPRFQQLSNSKKTKAVFDPTFTGSIREMSDSSGNIQDQRTYDLFGRVTKVQGSLSSDFQFGGYYEHQPSGLNLTATRAYSPTLGRFISRDPLAEKAGTNLYAYMNNHPEIGVDPSGQCAVAIAVPIIAGLSALEAAGLTIGLGGIAWSAGQIVGGSGAAAGSSAVTKPKCAKECHPPTPGNNKGVKDRLDCDNYCVDCAAGDLSVYIRCENQCEEFYLE
jgi:RHS repeat-associated protein